jgi:hypothetical protein
MVSDTMKMEDPMGLHLGKSQNNFWSHAQLNHGFHVEEHRSLFGSVV